MEVEIVVSVSLNQTLAVQVQALALSSVFLAVVCPLTSVSLVITAIISLRNPTLPKIKVRNFYSRIICRMSDSVNPNLLYLQIFTGS